MQKAENSQRDWADIVLDALGYPENGEDESARLEWLAKRGIPIGFGILASGIILALLVK